MTQHKTESTLSTSIELALFSPRIAANVGAIGRLCAALKAPLHIIRPIPFSLTDQTLKRSGMDYWDRVDCRIHNSFLDFREATDHRRLVLLSTHGEKAHWDFEFASGDILFFGNEPHGVSDDVRDAIPADQRLRIPMPDSESRSLNLSMSCGIVAYEALRQLN